MSHSHVLPQATGTAPGRERELFLRRRRREVLALVESLIELLDDLARQVPIRDCEPVWGDLGVIRGAAGPLADDLGRALHHQSADDRFLNHDARTPLSIVIQYAEALAQDAPDNFMDGFLQEFQEIRSIAQRILDFVDGTVAYLRSPSHRAGLDELESYLVRGRGDAGAADLAEFADRGDCGDAPAHPEPGRILVVEDHEPFRKLLHGLLARQGHEVVPVGDGHSALERLAGEPFDLILTDIEMPGLDGFGLLDHLKASESHRDIPVIVVSGHGDLDAICRCIQMGADEYLPKPFHPVILRTRVDACLGKKRHRDRYFGLLRDILPAPVVRELTQNGREFPARRRENVAVMFADIVGFTTYCERHRDCPEVVVRHLKRAFESWEASASALGVQKIKTIGDAFMAASGLLDDREDPVLDCVKCGLEMIRSVRALTDDDGKGVGWDLRVGIHVGPVIAGVLGKKQSLLDLWGDTVNVASRHESHGRPGHINLSQEAWDDVRGCLDGWDPFAGGSWIRLKGTKGRRMVYHLDPDKVRIKA